MTMNLNYTRTGSRFAEFTKCMFGLLLDFPGNVDDNV